MKILGVVVIIIAGLIAFGMWGSGLPEKNKDGSVKKAAKKVNKWLYLIPVAFLILGLAAFNSGHGSTAKRPSVKAKADSSSQVVKKPVYKFSNDPLVKKYFKAGEEDADMSAVKSFKLKNGIIIATLFENTPSSGKTFNHIIESDVNNVLQNIKNNDYRAIAFNVTEKVDLNGVPAGTKTVATFFLYKNTVQNKFKKAGYLLSGPDFMANVDAYYFVSFIYKQDKEIQSSGLSAVKNSIKSDADQEIYSDYTQNNLAD